MVRYSMSPRHASPSNCMQLLNRHGAVHLLHFPAPSADLGGLEPITCRTLTVSLSLRHQIIDISIIKITDFIRLEIEPVNKTGAKSAYRGASWRNSVIAGESVSEESPLDVS